MSATAYVKQQLKNLKPKENETIPEFAERMYNRQCQAYGEYAGGDFQNEPFFALKKTTKKEWLETARKLGAKEPIKVKLPRAKPRKMATVRIPVENIIRVLEDHGGHEAGVCVICGAHGWVDQIKHKKGCTGAKALIKGN